jgi:hypothetical protein
MNFSHAAPSSQVSPIRFNNSVRTHPSNRRARAALAQSTLFTGNECVRSGIHSAIHGGIRSRNVGGFRTRGQGRAVSLFTVVSETNEREGLRFSSEPFSPQIRVVLNFFCTSNVRARRIVGGNHGFKARPSSRGGGALRIHVPGATRMGTRKLLARR